MNENVLLPKRQLRELHLFAGCGGGILGGLLLGHTPVCAVEIEPFCRDVLFQRQRDGILPRFPIADDVCQFDGKPWREKVDVVCGGFPCQDISIANSQAIGLSGLRSGLWKEQTRIIGEILPEFAWIENSPRLTVLGGCRVIADLTKMGFDCRWGIMGSHHAGKPIKRKRIWILASNRSKRREASREGKVDLQFTKKTDCTWEVSTDRENNLRILRSRYSPEILSRDFRGDNELASRMDRLTATGNGQDASLVALAWRILSQ